MEQKMLDLINESRSLNVSSIREDPHRAFVIINLLCDDVEKNNPMKARIGDFVKVRRTTSGVPKDALGKLGLVIDLNNEIALVKLSDSDKFWINLKDLRLQIVRKEE